MTSFPDTFSRHDRADLPELAPAFAGRPGRPVGAVGPVDVSEFLPPFLTQTAYFSEVLQGAVTIPAGLSAAYSLKRIVSGSDLGEFGLFRAEAALTACDSAGTATNTQSLTSRAWGTSGGANAAILLVKNGVNLSVGSWVPYAAPLPGFEAGTANLVNPNRDSNPPLGTFFFPPGQFTATSAPRAYLRKSWGNVVWFAPGETLDVVLVLRRAEYATGSGGVFVGNAHVELNLVPRFYPRRP